MKPRIFLIILFAIIADTLMAKHILGGTMSYRYLEANSYEITLILYKDASVGATTFDMPARIGVYKCGSSVPCSSLTQLDAFSFPTPSPLLPDVVYPPYYINLKVPEIIKVEMARYIFKVILPLSTESYFIAYQRCCLTNNVINIIDPASIGITCTIEITPKAQKLHSSSPEFKLVPLTHICVNEELNFDHSAIDADGDSLIYELCAPLNGGGMNGSESDCDGILPDPSCPPPYLPAVFGVSFSKIKPFGQNAASYIDSGTGLLTVNPDQLGIFYNGICVKEYRKNELLSTTIRQMTTFVVICEPLSTASIADKNAFELVINNLSASRMLTMEFKSLNQVEMKSVEVINTDGRTLIAHSLDNNITNYSCNIGSLSPGMYFVRAISKDNYSVIKKFVID